MIQTKANERMDALAKGKDAANAGGQQAVESKAAAGADRQSIEAMVAQVQAGETAVYAGIVQHYQQSIYRYCLRLLANRQDAEDAAQEIFFKAYGSIHSYKAGTSFSSWLYKVAYHYSLNLLRQRRLRQHLLWRLFLPEVPAESAEQAMEKRLFSPELSAALAALKPEERSLLILRVFEERTLEELSEITGSSPEALKKKISRIKARLKRTMTTWQEEEVKWEKKDQAIQMKT